MHRLIQLVILLVASSSLAQAQPWWLVTKGIPQGDLFEVREEVRTLLSREDIRVLEDGRARERFETEISVPPTFVTQSQINEWAQRSRSALLNLANADYERAREDLLAAQNLSDRAAEELNRESDRARAVLDTCLYMVRSFVETHDEARAVEQARACRRMVPQIEPSRHEHTPEVQEILERLDQERSSAPAAVLRVESSPSNCLVRLNGIQVGRTPVAMADLARGEYRLQVECSETRGRVHRLNLDEEVTHVQIDTVFDQEVHSRPVHVNDNARADSNVAALAAKLGATVVLVARDGDRFVLTRFEPDWRISSDPIPRSELAEAIAAITRDRPEQHEFEQPQERDRGPQPGVPGWRIGVGVGLLAAGAALVVGGAISHGTRSTRGDQYVTAEPMDTDFLARQSRWLDLKRRVLGLAITGGALAASSVAAWLPNRRGIRPLSWVAGAAGVIAAGTSIALLVTRDGCDSSSLDRQQCVDRGQTGGIAAMLASASLFLLAIPIVDALRSDPTENDVTRSSLRFDLGPIWTSGPVGVYATLGGRFQ